MTVEQLIADLRLLPPQSTVWISYPDPLYGEGRDSIEVDSVTEDEDGSVLVQGYS